MTTRYLAQVRRNEDELFAIYELEEHLRVVGDRSEEDSR